MRLLGLSALVLLLVGCGLLASGVAVTRQGDTLALQPPTWRFDLVAWTAA